MHAKIKTYIIGVTCICLIFLACETESDKRKARIQQLEKEIKVLEEKEAKFQKLFGDK